MAKDFAPVAIVDDDGSVLKALHRFLTAAGFEALAYSSGREFLESLDEHPVCCVLLDIRMPGLDGFAVARRLAERIDRIPVIFQSSYDSDSNLRQAEKQGVTAFLRKPASEEKILGAVRQAMDSANPSADEDHDRTKVI
jgi:two-component system response regulator FixJ